MESPLVNMQQACQNCVEGIAELVSKVLVLFIDWLLLIFALVAMNKDWNNVCDEPLLFYAGMCVALCLLDMIWEMARCSMESQLDKLQSEFRCDASAAAQGNEGLLNDAGQDGVVQSQGLPVGSKIGSITGGAIGAAFKKEKATKQKRTKELHFWSIVFSCFVSIVFSFFSSHDEDCKVHVPHLYSYIAIFNYVFIMRLGLIMVWVCCRAVKNYEDAASAAGSAGAQGVPPEAMELRTF